jgi:predicted nuclease of restriction endonuclease-like (RecB) superfamily
MTASAMSQAAMLPSGYAEWIADVKRRIRAAQQRAALAVNKKMLQLYWQIGRDILDRQAVAGWGTGVLSRIEADLRAEFPDMRGFSRSNLAYMRAFAEAWPDPDVIVQRFVGQLPWGQNITLLTKLKTREERLRYAACAVEHGWSRPLLTHHIELRTLEREGKAVTRLRSARSRPRSSRTSRSSCWSWALASRSSGVRFISRSAGATSTSTCSSITCICAASWCWSSRP